MRFQVEEQRLKAEILESKRRIAEAEAAISKAATEKAEAEKSLRDAKSDNSNVGAWAASAEISKEMQSSTMAGNAAFDDPTPYDWPRREIAGSSKGQAQKAWRTDELNNPKKPWNTHRDYKNINWIWDMPPAADIVAVENQMEKSADYVQKIWIVHPPFEAGYPEMRFCKGYLDTLKKKAADRKFRYAVLAKLVLKDLKAEIAKYESRELIAIGAET